MNQIEEISQELWSAVQLLESGQVDNATLTHDLVRTTSGGVHFFYIKIQEKAL